MQPPCAKCQGALGPLGILAPFGAGEGPGAGTVLVPMGAQSHTLGCAGLLFTSGRRQPCHVSPPGAEAGDMAALARSVLVTGSSRGIGLELVRQLAASPRPPQHIFATCRDPKGPRGKVSAGTGNGVVLSQVSRGDPRSPQPCWLAALAGQPRSALGVSQPPQLPA